MDSDSNQSESNFIDHPVPEDDRNWWETLEGHRFAGEVLQLQIRRRIMSSLGMRQRPKRRSRESMD
jgi:hypothetical protein